MKLYVLAAGYATRLYPITANRAKPLLEVGGAPILTRILDRALALEDISEIIVIANDRFAKDFQAWRRSYASPVPITILNDGSRCVDDRLGAIGDMAFALDQIPLNGEDWMVVAGDNLLEFDLTSVFQHFREHGYTTLVVRTREPESPGGSRYNEVRLGPEHRVTHFVEKPTSPISPLAATAVYLFPAEVAPLLRTYLSAGHPCDAPGHFISWLVDQVRVTAAPLRGDWYDIGDLASLEEARRRLTPESEQS